MSGVIACDCGQLACVVCDDAAEHPDGYAHCSDPRCVAACAQCQADSADDYATLTADDLALERCETEAAR